MKTENLSGHRQSKVVYVPSGAGLVKASIACDPPWWRCTWVVPRPPDPREADKVQPPAQKPSEAPNR